VTAVDPKESCFELRMKCKWSFRTQHGDEKTETKLRVPGVRLPGLKVEVNESRVWKDLVKSRRSSNTIFWRGISLFTIRGFERFEMQDFPFDRQLMSLDVFEFVWQQEKHSKDYDFSMHIVSFRVECVSMLPAWKAFPCIIQADPSSMQQQAYISECQDQEPPQYASRFRVQLRIERKKWFYIYQLFCLTILITWATLLPLMMPASEDHVGDRLGLYSGGVLTLTAVKYSVGEQLPCVPYMTKFDRIMFYEIFTIVVCAFEALLAFRIVGTKEFELFGMNGEDLTGWIEFLMFIGFLSFWWLMLLHLSLGDKVPCGMKHRDWKYILDHQEAQADFDEVLNEHDGMTQSLTQRHPGTQLAKVSRDMCNYLAEGNEADEEFQRLKMKRDALEEELAKRSSPKGTRGGER